MALDAVFPAKINVWVVLVDTAVVCACMVTKCYGLHHNVENSGSCKVQVRQV